MLFFFSDILPNHLSCILVWMFGYASKNSFVCLDISLSPSLVSNTICGILLSTDLVFELHYPYLLSIEVAVQDSSRAVFSF